MENIQHPTSNTEHPINTPRPVKGSLGVGCWMLDVSSFIAQRLDGVELRSFACRIKAEENSHRRAEDEGDDDGIGGNQRGPVFDEGEHFCATDAERNTKDAADGTKGDGFDQKLQENIDRK